MTQNMTQTARALVREFLLGPVGSRDLGQAIYLLRGSSDEELAQFVRRYWGGAAFNAEALAKEFATAREAIELEWTDLTTGERL